MDFMWLQIGSLNWLTTCPSRKGNLSTLEQLRQDFELADHMSSSSIDLIDWAWGDTMIKQTHLNIACSLVGWAHNFPTLSSPVAGVKFILVILDSICD